MMMLKNALPFAVAIALFSSSAFALEVPKGGADDKRIKYVTYNASDVVKIVGHYGWSTHIQFAPGEKVGPIAIGDKDAWNIAPVDNHLFIKPIAANADTNMTVLTDRRVYNFDLSTAPSQSKHGQYFEVNFKYPTDEAARLAAEADAQKLRNSMNQDPALQAKNWNYWGKGAADLSPTRVFDDGKFTYISFGQNQDFPDIKIVGLDGNESRVNTHTDPNDANTIVVQKTARKLILRRGKTSASVFCIFNEGYTSYAPKDHTATTIPGFKRVVKGGE